MISGEIIHLYPEDYTTLTEILIFFVGYFTTLSLSGKCSDMEGWQINWKGFRRKRSWATLGIIPAFIRRDWGKNTKMFIQHEWCPGWSPEYKCYRYTNLLILKVVVHILTIVLRGYEWHGRTPLGTPFAPFASIGDGRGGLSSYTRGHSDFSARPLCRVASSRNTGSGAGVWGSHREGKRRRTCGTRIKPSYGGATRHRCHIQKLVTTTDIRRTIKMNPIISFRMHSSSAPLHWPLITALPAITNSHIKISGFIRDLKIH